MAKTEEVKKTSFQDVASIIKKFSPLSGALKDGNADIPDWISSGNYALNCLISGDMFKGFPAGRVSGIAGSPETGKTMIALNACVQAQKKGYKIIWFDSEYAFNIESAKDFGVDVNNFIVVPENQLDKIGTIFSNIVEPLIIAKEEKQKIDKYMFVLDSLGFTIDDRTAGNTLSGKNAADMGYIAKEKKKLFNGIINACGKIGAPFIVTNHTYTTIGDFIPTQTPAGGSGFGFAPSVTLLLSKAQFKQFGEKTGTIVTVKPFKSRFVVPHAKIKILIESSIGLNEYVGLETFFSEEKAIEMGFGPGKVLKGTGKYTYDAKEIPLYWSLINEKKVMPNFGKLVTDKNGEQRLAGAAYQSKYFTKERLEKINEWAKDMFKFKSLNLDEDLEVDISDDEIKEHPFPLSDS